ncbi:head protein [Histophilus somni]|uniref:Mu-like prophage major head subunit gpT family protein n=1 Tax=Histophilus somni TaxID=731 RepID=A0A9Q6P5C7_HISSO|nr:Mu-like prophage major head subunit gpT family protein [Histophilus somni]ARU65480.1 head protein [Histophilus somni]ARU67348.1 head protein [Histophilus somni]ARU69228.1 head protein [Histophilus somni]ARU71105.1 head protein [Histophilus somni]ARU72976.1 head protein [Histophilus somni]
MSFKKSEQLNILDTVFKKEFKNGLGLMKPQWEVVAMAIPSSTQTNTYGWLGHFPKMREWVGERQIQKMQAQGMTIENKLFESTVSVPRTNIEDDQVGMFSTISKQAGQSAAELPDDLVFSLLKKGKTTQCYDGKMFFGIDHPVYENVDGTGKSENQRNLTTGKAGKSTKPSGAGVADGASENGKTDKPAFYILDTTNAIKPLIWQERTKPEIEPKFDPSKSDKVFMEDIYLWGVRARGNAGFGFWQLIHRVENSEMTKEVLVEVITTMRHLKGDGGKLLNIRPNVLLVPPSLEYTARQLVEADVINGTTNVLKGVLKVEVSPFIVE